MRSQHEPRQHEDPAVHAPSCGVADESAMGRRMPSASRVRTAAVKREIRDSRVRGTKLLCQTLAGLASKPSMLVSASAIGFGMAMTSGVSMKGVPSPAIGPSPASVRRWSTMAPQALDAGDQTTGRGPSRRRAA